MFAVDGCKLPSNASKEWSGTRADFERMAAKMERALAHLVKAYARQSGQRGKTTPEQRWIAELACRIPFGKLLVAIANKHARQLWAMLAHGVDYEPNAAMAYSMEKRSITHPAPTAM